MPPRREICRNFSTHGSCRYGDQCKFLHAAQTPSNTFGFGAQNGNQFQHSNLQQKKSNPFGFGVQSGNQFQHSNLQQQKPNPFGFGMQGGNQSQHANLQQQKSNPFGFDVQSNSQTRGGASDFGSKQSQFKPFENKWIRPSQSNASGSSASRQPDNQSAPHKCTDPESCKRMMAEDFQNERPLWKLTCYGHTRNGPCDIVGDISCEELRTAAYEDAMRGSSLQAIVERERNLLSSKLLEFDSVIHNPYKVPSNSAIGIQSPFRGNMQNASVIAQSSNPPSFSSFSQLGTSFGVGSTTTNSLFGQPHPFQSTNQTSSMFMTSNSPFGNSGSFGSELPSQPLQSPIGSSSTGFSNSSNRAQQSQFFSSRVLSQSSSSTGDPFKGSSSAPGSGGLVLDSTKLTLKTPEESVGGDDSIWMQERWTIGKIPESAPPAQYCH